MLTKRTVLVLGAGASVPYLFPTGGQLSERVTNYLAPSASPRQQLRELCGFSDEEIGEFRDTFFHSGKDSVDAFLEHRSEFMTIGKAAIALILIQFEEEDRLFQYDRGNWLRYLYNQLSTTFNTFESNRLSIITFNYDRTIEHFLFTSLKNSHGKSDEECAEVLKSIPIIHLHGCLGYLPWQPQAKAKVNASRGYEQALSPAALQTCIENIKIVHEDISDGRDKDFEDAKGLLKNADQLFFLGFGYNATNLQRLDIANLKVTAHGTAVGLSEREKARIDRACNGKVSLQAGDCLHFMRELVDWD
jgi:hypothetical protein